MTRRLGLIALALCSLVIGCGDDEQRTLRIDLRTDLVPLVEFDTATLALGDAVYLTEASESSDWTEPSLLNVHTLPEGDVRFSVGLDRLGETVLSRDVFVDLSSDVSVTVVLTRDCRGVECGDGASGACLGGECVDEGCVTGGEEACGAEPQCTSDDECGGADVCGGASCSAGVCLVQRDDSECSGDDRCVPDLGCQALLLEVRAEDAGTDSGDVDAGEDDGGDDDAGDAELDTSDAEDDASDDADAGTEDADASHDVGVDAEDDAADDAADDATEDGAPDTDTPRHTVYTEILYGKREHADPADYFGRSVAMNADGSSMLVGIYGDDARAGASDRNNEATNSGSAMLMTQREAGDWWTGRFQAAASEDGDRFAYEVAISDDNSVFVASAMGDDDDPVVGGEDNSLEDSGAVYVFISLEGGYPPAGKIKAPNAGMGDRFGASLALSGDGQYLAVSAPGEDSASSGVGGDMSDDTLQDSGAAYIYRLDGRRFVFEAYIKTSNPGRNDAASFVTLNQDGSVLAFGAAGEDSDGSGESDNSASSSGAVYVYEREGSTWSQVAFLKAETPSMFDNFGGRMGLSNDGSVLAVAAGLDDGATGISQVGSVSVFERDGASWSSFDHLAWLQPETHTDHIGFGNGLCMSGDGQLIVVGAPRETGRDSGVLADSLDRGVLGYGAAYPYVRTEAGFELERYIKPSNMDQGDDFGGAIACSDDARRFVVGAARESSGGEPDDNSVDDAGAVYLFDRE